MAFGFELVARYTGSATYSYTEYFIYNTDKITGVYFSESASKRSLNSVNKIIG